MENIFKNAKFGDKFLTRDNRIVLYIEFYKRNPNGDILSNKNLHTVLIEGCANGYSYYRDNGLAIGKFDKSWDIVSRYKEPIDEDKLHKITKEYAHSVFQFFKKPPHFLTAFEDGYRKAKEE